MNEILAAIETTLGSRPTGSMHRHAPATRSFSEGDNSRLCELGWGGAGRTAGGAGRTAFLLWPDRRVALCRVGGSIEIDGSLRKRVTRMKTRSIWLGLSLVLWLGCFFEHTTLVQSITGRRLRVRL